jgi:hypothetical protein
MKIIFARVRALYAARHRRNSWLLIFTAAIWRGVDPHHAAEIADDGLIELQRRFSEVRA